GPADAINVFEVLDCSAAPQREGEVVEPLQQSLAPQRAQLERESPAAGRGDLAALDVDPEPFRAGACLFDEGRDLLCSEHDRHHAVLETVGTEDVAEARRDDAAEAHAAHGPHRRLARASAA